MRGKICIYDILEIFNNFPVISKKKKKKSDQIVRVGYAMKSFTKRAKM